MPHSFSAIITVSSAYKQSHVAPPGEWYSISFFILALRLELVRAYCDDVDNWLDKSCEVIRQETVLFSTPETDYIIYD